MSKLGDYTLIKTGKLDANASSENGEYPFFTCSKEPLRIDSYTYDCECVLVAGNGDLNVKYYKGKFEAYQRTYIIESKNSKILSVPYLYLFLDNYLDTLRQQSIGGVIKYIKLGNLTDAKIPLPPLVEQIKIANELDKINNLIEKRKIQLEKLDLLVRVKFVEMFGDPVENPMGWEKNNLKHNAKITTGNTPPRSNVQNYGDFIEWIKTDNITSDLYLTKAIEYLSEKGLEKGRFVEENCILMACIAGSIKSIGRVAITNRKVSFNQQINAITPINYNVLFLYNLFKNTQEYIQSTINMSLKGILSKGKLEDLEFIIPPLPLQNQFADYVQKVEATKQTLEKSLTHLETLYKQRMQHYFD